jgi:hypothetical protein
VPSDGNTHIQPSGRPLRFKVGDHVLCTMDGAWLPGTITQQYYQINAEGHVAAYQVELEKGGLIWAPSDADEIIKKNKKGKGGKGKK